MQKQNLHRVTILFLNAKASVASLKNGEGFVSTVHELFYLVAQTLEDHGGQ